MMPLYQHLEPGLDIGPLGIGFNSEHVERTALGIEDFAALGSRPRMPVDADPRDQIERVFRRETLGAEVGGTPAVAAAPATAAADRPHFPGRTMPGEVLFLIFGDGVIAHAGEKVVGVVVFADVFETELPVFAGAQAPFRRAMRRRRVALRPLAPRQICGAAAIAVRLDADSIKQW